MKSNFTINFLIIIAGLLGGCASNHRDLSSFTAEKSVCYQRDKETYTAVVDSHLHFRPFGGTAIPLTELLSYFRQTGVLFANMYGIGQILPVNSACTYYLDCPGIAALPSIKNDFVNAANYLEIKPEDIQLTLSMTFPDLANPQDIVNMIHLYDREFPKMFHWMGEVNLIKQALIPNQHQPATEASIKEWSGFMQILRDRQIPLNVHADLGNDNQPTQFLPLIESMLKNYPQNLIVWAHMGLSKELTKMNPQQHIQIVKSLLDRYPKLMVDISWSVLNDNYFSHPEIRPLYIDFFNQYATRILPGTDFVASRDKQFADYRRELELTSNILQYLNDEAFRNIALGNNYFRLLGLKYQAPLICQVK
jgi:hypothetical protein